MNPFDQLHPALQHHIVNSLGWSSLRPFQEEAIGPLVAGQGVFLLIELRRQRLYPGLFFRRVCEGDLKGIIGLPANLFYGTGIPACIVVLDKENAAGRKGVFMIDASRGFRKDGPKNRLREQDIHRIVDTFTRQIDVPRYARMVPLATSIRLSKV